MEKQLFIVSAAPHITKNHSVKTFMFDTIVALLPAGFFAVSFFGFYSGLLILVSVIFAIVSELFVNILRKQKISISDLSCIITGILFAYTLPPRLPLWIAALGVSFGIIFGKNIYGGLGFNTFNPALIGRAFVHIAFPHQMGDFSFDTFSSATPLTILKHFPENFNQLPSLKNLLIGNYLGSIGETSVIFLLLGYFYLVLKKHINPFVPFIYISVVGIISFFVDQKNFLTYLFSGGIFLGGIFMITDPVTTPVSFKGKTIFAICCAVLTCIIRFWGSYPEGVCFSILFMNLFTPFIDNYTIVKKFGLLMKK